MIGYERLIYEMIDGKTPKEKYDNLRGMINACTAICYPRRGTPENDMSIQEAANMLFQYVQNPNHPDKIKDRVDDIYEDVPGGKYGNVHSNEGDRHSGFSV